VYTDKTMTCRECGASFIFTAGEQEFYASKGFTHEPARCPSCRAARNRGGGNVASATGGYGGGYERREREMHSVTCANCGKEALVPFLPRGDRPVYCSECFEQQRTGGAYAGGGRGNW
jgi:CxxC-x17-CxxC domain-containing protein